MVLDATLRMTAAIKKLNKLKNRSGPISVIAPDRKTAIDWMYIKKNQESKVGVQIS